MTNVADALIQRYRDCIENADLPPESRAILEIRLPRVVRCREIGERRRAGFTGWDQRCQLPICCYCGGLRAKRDFKKVHAIASAKPRSRLHVATFSLDSEHPDSGLKHLNKSLGRLRRYKAFRGVEGGWLYNEVTRHSNYLTFHPHVHCIVETRSSLDGDLIFNAWQRATRAETHIHAHVRRVRRLEGAVRYCTKRDFESRLELDDFSLLEITLSDIGARPGRLVGSWRGPQHG